MAKAKVLIVEDENIVALDLQNSLTGLGYFVPAIVSSGEEAIQKAAETRPDLMLVDIRLKGDMDGIEAAEKIQACFDIPVIYLTAFVDEDTVRRARITEPYGYILKPFEERELHTAIEIALYKHQMERKLRQRNAELEARNEELDAFAHTVAHDLKNPLGLVGGFAQMLLKDCAATPGEEAQMCLRAIARNARKMNNIVDELLLLAEVRKTKVAMEPLDLESIVAQAQQRIAHMIEERQAEVVLPDTWPAAVGYGPWVEEVWVNYLSNAIKYGGQPPRVELGATAQADRTVCIWVRDNGSGISEEDLPLLFTPFTRLGQVHAKGHGLGLSIVRRIVEKLGGQVGVESEVGHGSVFSFTLPAIQLDQPGSEA